MKKGRKRHRIKIKQRITIMRKGVKRKIDNIETQKKIVWVIIFGTIFVTINKMCICFIDGGTLIDAFNAFDAIDIVACVATGLVWIELKQSKMINEAQLVKDINSEFINNQQLSMVERALEVYYDTYRNAKNNEERKRIKLNLCMAIDSEERQSLVNYLVHLEAVASLVNNGALRLDSINDLVAYRFFIAVNNRVVQEYELLPFVDYYSGCYKLYGKWAEQMKDKNMEVPMEKQGEILLKKWEDRENDMKIRTGNDV